MTRRPGAFTVRRTFNVLAVALWIALALVLAAPTAASALGSPNSEFAANAPGTPTTATRHGYDAAPNTGEAMVSDRRVGAPSMARTGSVVAAPGEIAIASEDFVAAETGGSRARFVTGGDGATTDLLDPAGKLKFPSDLIPEGMKPNAYGNQVWGVGSQGAKDLIGTRSTAELRDLDLSVRGAQRWQDFYSNVANLHPNNAAAAARVDLMQNIITTLGGP